MKSLTNFVGMDTTPKRLGNLRDKITVSEAIVAVPFIEKNDQRHFFKIDPHMIDIVLGEEQYRLSDQSDEPGDSLRTLVRQMDKYVFPPVFDFVKNRGLVVFQYVFEFNMTFDKNDLSYIWQNLMPPSAKKFETSTSTITHNLLINELMGYSNKKTGQPMRDKVKWMVFKVKQRSNTNYYDKVVASTPELDKLDKIERSRQVSLGNSSDAKYGFNWPYDHFSIIEMAQIKASVEFSALPQNIPTILRVDDTGSRPTVQGQYIKPPVPGLGTVGSTNPRLGSSGTPGAAGSESGGAIVAGTAITPVDPSATPQFAGSDDNTVGSGLTRQLAPGFDPRQQAAFDPAMSVSAEDVIQREQLYGDIDRYTSIPTSTGPIAGTFGFDDGTVSEPPTSGGGTGGIGGRGGLGFGFDLGGGLIGGSPTDFGSSLSDFEGLADTNFGGNPLGGYGY